MRFLHDMGQSLGHLLVHAIFSTKDRRPFLHSEEMRQLQELTSEGHAEGVAAQGGAKRRAKRNPGSRMLLCDPLRAAESSERVSSNVGISPGVGLLRSS